MSMRNSGTLAILLALAGLVALAGSAPAQGIQYYFEFEGVDGRNPTVALAPGDHVTLSFESGKGVHNIAIGAPVSEKTATLSEGEDAEVLVFTVPDDAAGSTIEYWCDPHKGLKMAGTFTVSEASGGDGRKSFAVTGMTGPSDGGDTNGAPGFEAALVGVAILGAVLLFRRR